MTNQERKIVVGEAVNPEDAIELSSENTANVDLDQVFEWQAEEFEYHEKGTNWKWGLFGTAAVLIVIFLLTKNYTAAVLVVAGTGLVYRYAFIQPRLLHYVISKDGVTVGEVSSGFDKFESFWISRDGFLYFNRSWRPRLTIKLNGVDVGALEEFLQVFLEKIDRSDRDSSDRLGEVFKL